MDEKPIIRHPHESLSQFQHGNVVVEEGNLSIAMVFRHVSNTLIYDNITCKRVLSSTFIHDNREHLHSFDKTLQEYRNNQQPIGHMFSKHAKGKLFTWNWINVTT